jgi:hypothetical protein
MDALPHFAVNTNFSNESSSLAVQRNLYLYGNSPFKL